MDDPAHGARQTLDIARLVAEHHQIVYRYAFRLTGSSADAEDVSQQTFLVAQQKLDQLRDPLRGRSWLLAIARNCYLKNLRRRSPQLAGNLDLDIDHLASADTAADGADTPIDQEQLQKSIDELPDEFKIVLVMFYFEQRSYKQIAEDLQLPPGTVMSRLSRAKSHLRARLSGKIDNLDAANRAAAPTVNSQAINEQRMTSRERTREGKLAE